MKKILVIVLIFLSSTAYAATHEEELITHLQSQGFKLVEREATWLGRISLEFESDTHEREIILNPNNGAILRDYKEPLDDNDEDDTTLDKFYGLFSKERD
ncbi:MAG: hypothetical protein ABJO57_19135 [Lentilitoribacter sp.]